MSRHDNSGSFILAVSEIDELAIGCSISGVNLIVGKEPICRVLQQTRTALQPPDLTPRPGEPGELARRWATLGDGSSPSRPNTHVHCVRVQCRGGGPWAGGRAAGSVIDNNVTPIHALFRRFVHYAHRDQTYAYFQLSLYLRTRDECSRLSKTHMMYIRIYRETGAARRCLGRRSARRRPPRPAPPWARPCARADRPPCMRQRAYRGKAGRGRSAPTPKSTSYWRECRSSARPLASTA